MDMGWVEFLVPNYVNPIFIPAAFLSNFDFVNFDRSAGFYLRSILILAVRLARRFAWRLG